MVNKPIAVVASHPDDEVLGCGAALARHVLDGDTVHVLILSEGLASRNNFFETEEYKNEVYALRQAALEANREIGVSSVDFLDFPDNRMDSVDLLEIVKAVELFFAKYKPSVVYTHFANDVNIDHQKAYEAVIVASRPYPGQAVRTILCFETVSSTEWQPPIKSLPFSPNWFVAVDQKCLGAKLKALMKYESEMREFPHPRSEEALRALATWRGASIGVEAAEAFILVRNLS